MLQNETNVRQYAEDTLQPITSSTHLKSQNYHYYLTLKQRYHSPENAPAYLSKKGYEILRQNDCALMDTFRIHTDSILNTLRKCDEDELTIWVGMDHMDWHVNFSVRNMLSYLTKACVVTGTTPSAVRQQGSTTAKKTGPTFA